LITGCDESSSLAGAEAVFDHGLPDSDTEGLAVIKAAPITGPDLRGLQRGRQLAHEPDV
jgi:hypothetical protein